MVTPVSGYLTKDGKFYRSAEEANYEEALDSMHEFLEALGIPYNQITNFIKLCESHHAEIKNFILAFEATRTGRGAVPTTGSSKSHFDDREDDEAIQSVTPD